MCFPEAYLPGVRGQDCEVLPFDRTQQERALRVVAQWARMYSVATILGTERLAEAGRQIAAFVQESATSLIAPSGQCQAYLLYGQEGILVQSIEVEEATGLLAARYAPERYQEFRSE